MTVQLRRIVASPVVKRPDGVAPYVALEHLVAHLGNVVETWTGDPVLAEGSVEFQTGDVLFGKLRPYLHKVWHADRPGHCSTELLVLRAAAADLHPRYLYYLALSRAFVDWAIATSYGTKMPRTSWELLGQFEFAPPPVKVQSVVADFLDRETERIDALVAKKRRLIELLEEKRTALISHVVTKGLDSTAPMNDSGIPWIGAVPSHWRVGQLRRWIMSISDGPFGSALKSSHYSDSGARVIRLGNVGQATFLRSDVAFISSDYYEQLWAFAVEPGDLIVAGLGDERRTLGRACVVPANLGPAIVKADCFRLRLHPNADHVFVAEYLSSAPGAAGAWALARGTTRQRINTTITRDLPVPMPRLDEQKRIVGFVTELRSTVGKVVVALHHQLDLLAEHRQALITAAVTGQIDVTAEAPDPEEVLA